MYKLKNNIQIVLLFSKLVILPRFSSESPDASRLPQTQGVLLPSSYSWFYLGLLQLMTLLAQPFPYI